MFTCNMVRQSQEDIERATGGLLRRRQLLLLVSMFGGWRYPRCHSAIPSGFGLQVSRICFGIFSEQSDAFVYIPEQ